MKAGLIDEMQLQAALAYQRQWGGKLGDALVANNFLDEMMMWRGLSRQLAVPLVSLPEQGFAPGIEKTVPVEMCRKHSIVPVSKDARELTVATSEPNNIAGIDEVAFRVGTRLKVVLAPDREVEWAIRRLYAGESAPCPPPRQRRVIHGAQGVADVVSVSGRSNTVEFSSSGPPSPQSASSSGIRGPVAGGNAPAGYSTPAAGYRAPGTAPSSSTAVATSPTAVAAPTPSPFNPFLGKPPSTQATTVAPPPGYPSTGPSPGTPAQPPMNPFTGSAMTAHSLPPIAPQSFSNTGAAGPAGAGMGGQAVGHSAAHAAQHAATHSGAYPGPSPASYAGPSGVHPAPPFSPGIANVTSTVTTSSAQTEAALRENAAALRFIVEACIARGVFTREEYVARVKAQP